MLKQKMMSQSHIQTRSAMCIALWDYFMLFISEVKEILTVSLESYRLLEVKTIYVSCFSKAAYQPHKQMEVFKGIH